MTVVAEKFSASRAQRLMHCHASADLERAIPGYEPPVEDPDADNAANRGTRMHELFAAVLSLPKSDAKHLSDAMRYVVDLMDRRRFKKLIEVEWVADWLPSKPRTTADLVLYLRDEIHIVDLKTGKTPVSAHDNDQLLFYAATYLDFAPMAQKVTMHIVQPWANNMDYAEISGDDLVKWMIEAARHDTLIMDGDLTFDPGDHCMFCPANPHGRGARGSASCPVMLDILYPGPKVDTDQLLTVLEED